MNHRRDGLPGPTHNARGRPCVATLHAAGISGAGMAGSDRSSRASRTQRSGRAIPNSSSARCSSALSPPRASRGLGGCAPCVRSPWPGASERPCRDRRTARRRGSPPAELRRTGVVRILEQPVSERLVLDRGRVAEHTRHETTDRLDDHGCGNLSTGEDDITNRDLAVAQMFADPLVDTFVAAAQQREAVEFGEFVAIDWSKRRPEGER